MDNSNGRPKTEDDSRQQICIRIVLATEPDTNNNNHTMVEAPAVDWRTNLKHDSHQRIINKITDIIKKRLLLLGPEGQVDFKKMAEVIEEKCYTDASSQSDYLRKLSLEIESLEGSQMHHSAGQK